MPGTASAVITNHTINLLALFKEPGFTGLLGIFGGGILGFAFSLILFNLQKGKEIKQKKEEMALRVLDELYAYVAFITELIDSFKLTPPTKDDWRSKINKKLEENRISLARSRATADLFMNKAVQTTLDKVGKSLEKRIGADLDEQKEQPAMKPSQRRRIRSKFKDHLDKLIIELQKWAAN